MKKNVFVGFSRCLGEIFGLVPSPSRCTWFLLLLALAYTAWSWNNRLYLPYFPYGQEGDDPMMLGNSLWYIRFNAMRWAGYPLFLDLAVFIFGTLEAVPKLQLILQAGAIGFLGWAIYHAFAAPWLASAAALILFGLSAVVRFHFYIGSEALFLPLLFTMMALFILLLTYRRARLTFAAALLCGLAVIVRPAGLGLLAIWPLLLWFLWRQYPAPRWRLAVAATVPLVLCLLAERSLWDIYHPDSENRPSLVNRHFFSKALMIETQPLLEDKQLLGLLAESRQEMAPSRELLAAIPNWQLRAILLHQFEEMAQHHSLFFHRFSHRAAELAAERGSSGNHILGEAGRAALLAAPGEWAANALHHYAALWFNYRIYGQELSRQYATYVKGLEDSPLFQEARLNLPLQAKPQGLVLLNQVGAPTLFLTSLLALGLTAWQWLRRGGEKTDNRLVSAALCALVVHGYFLLIGIFGTPGMRYASTMWSFQVLCALLLLHCIARQRHRQDARNAV